MRKSLASRVVEERESLGDGTGTGRSLDPLLGMRLVR
jgi:hypothetical protein